MKQNPQTGEAPVDGDNIVVYASKRKTLGLAYLGVALTLLCVVAALLGPTALSGYRGSPFGLVIVYLSVVALFLMTVYAFFLAFSSAPRLVVSRDGIWVNSPFVYGTEIVPWSEIVCTQVVKFRILPMNTQTYLVIQVHNQSTLRARQNRVQALLYLLSGYRLIWPRAVVVNDTILRMPSAELMGRIRVRYGPELARFSIRA